MHEDPIVEEVRKRREENAKRFDSDVRAIAEDARKREPASGHPLVTPEPREPRKYPQVHGDARYMRERPGSAAPEGRTEL